MSGHVFVSHSSKDASYAARLVAALEAAGQPCWVAPRDIRPGHAWAAEIMEGIQNARAMLVLISGNANSSEHVGKEVELANRERKRVLPLRITNVEPGAELRYFLSAAHWMDAIGRPPEEAARMVVAGLAGTTETITRTARPASGPPLWAIAGGVAGLALTVALTAVLLVAPVGGPDPAMPDLQLPVAGQPVTAAPRTLPTPPPLMPGTRQAGPATGPSGTPDVPGRAASLPRPPAPTPDPTPSVGGPARGPDTAPAVPSLPRAAPVEPQLAAVQPPPQPTPTLPTGPGTAPDARPRTPDVAPTPAPSPDRAPTGPVVRNITAAAGTWTPVGLDVPGGGARAFAVTAEAPVRVRIDGAVFLLNGASPVALPRPRSGQLDVKPARAGDGPVPVTVTLQP